MAQRVIDLLAGGPAQRQEAYAALDRLASAEASDDGAATGEMDDPLAIAVACVGPLMEAAFAVNDSVVKAAEYQRACVVLGQLHSLDPLKLAAQAWRDNCLVIKLALGSPGNSYMQVFDRSVELTHEDALTVACATIFYAVFFSRGPELIPAEAGGTFDGVVTTMMEYNLVSPFRPFSDAFFLQLGVLLLDVIRNPQQHDTF